MPPSTAWGSGCYAGPPLLASSDDTVVTYVADYLTAVVGLGAAMASCGRRGASGPHKLYSGNFFLWTGISYGIAGLLHQLAKSKDHASVCWKVSYVSMLVGMASLLLLGVRVLAHNYAFGEHRLGGLNLAVLLAIGSAAAATLASDADVPLAPGVAALGLLAMALHWLFAASRGAAQQSGIKAAAALTTALGLAMQTFLATTCGSMGSRSCWQYCPLLSAGSVNQSACSQGLYCVGLALLAKAMHASPDGTDTHSLARGTLQDLSPKRCVLPEDTWSDGASESSWKASDLGLVAVRHGGGHASKEELGQLPSGCTLPTCAVM